MSSFKFGMIAISISTVLCGVSISAVAQKRPARPRTPAVLCRELRNLKELPFDPSNRGVDVTYDTFLDAGSAAIPCLIEKISDTTLMPDPRCPHVTDDTTVGDVAYFILVRLSKLKFTELLPSPVKEKFKTDGVYAYHEYIARTGSRERLQLKLRNWYQTTYRHI